MLERYRSCRVPFGKSIFHSSYYRLPSIISTPSVVTVHDLGYLAYPEAHKAGDRRYLDWSTRWNARRAPRTLVRNVNVRDYAVRGIDLPGGWIWQRFTQPVRRT